MPYKLSATLVGHSSDVRAVTSPTPNLVLSASRDKTAIAWNRNESGSSFKPSVFPAGSRYVNSVTYLRDEGPGYLVAGGQDTTITVFGLTNPKQQPDYTLVGHTENVCSLDAGNEGTIISGSWDKTARVWKDFRCVYTLEGHSQAVWAVLVLEPGKYLTASADKTIRLWFDNKTVHTYTGHTDAVRGLALLPGVGFASCSNDSEIRVWTLEGQQLNVLSGHTSFIYSLAALPSGEIVSSGEDRTVRIWRDGQCVQTIVHPAISVWCVSTMPNGDIVSGTSDGMIRVFSNSEERWASEVDLKEYESQVSSQTINKEQVGDLKQSDIKGPEVLNQPGTKDGQVVLVRQGTSVDAYQWDSSSGQWIKAGQVVDAVGSNRKQLYQGKEYDYVFDVDVQEGVPPLKLPYNAAENPYVAAQRFLDANDLPHTYLDEVVKFIEKNTTPVNLGGSDEYVDPFTGASRYRGSGAAAPVNANANAYVDPFTGASRYSGTPVQAAPPPPLVNKVLPIATPIAFKQANVPAMRNKAYQINDALKMEISTSAVAISSQEMHIVDQAFDCLTHSLGASSSLSDPRSTVTNETVEVVTQILERWPVSQRFPVIDLSRLISAFYPAAYAEPGEGATFFSALLDAAEWSEPWVSPLPKSRETNTLLALRSIANGLQVPQAAIPSIPDWLLLIFERLVQAPYESLTNQHRVVLATIAFNLSCILLKVKADSSVFEILQQLLIQTLTEEVKDGETIYRTLAALGNLLHASKIHGMPIDEGHAQVLHDLVESTVANISEDRVKNIGREILQLV